MMLLFSYSDVEKTYVLCYGQSLLYTWDEPMKSHELVCSFIEPKSTTETIALEKVSDFVRLAIRFIRLPIRFIRLHSRLTIRFIRFYSAKHIVVFC